MICQRQPRERDLEMAVRLLEDAWPQLDAATLKTVLLAWDPDRLWTAGEVAARARVTPSTVYRWGENKTLPCVTIGGVVRFRESDVAQVLLARHTPEGGDAA